jgi:hypothetical protein
MNGRCGPSFFGCLMGSHRCHELSIRVGFAFAREVIRRAPAPPDAPPGAIRGVGCNARSLIERSAPREESARFPLLDAIDGGTVVALHSGGARLDAVSSGFAQRSTATQSETHSYLFILDRHSHDSHRESVSDHVRMRG